MIDIFLRRLQKYKTELEAAPRQSNWYEANRVAYMTVVLMMQQRGYEVPKEFKDFYEKLEEIR